MTQTQCFRIAVWQGLVASQETTSLHSPSLQWPDRRGTLPGGCTAIPSPSRSWRRPFHAPSRIQASPRARHHSNNPRTAMNPAQATHSHTTAMDPLGCAR